jgi:putative oxidoreductase
LVADIGLFVLRLVVGGAYVAHGLRKLGWRNADGLAGFVGSISRRGYRPAAAWAAAAIVAEIVGGSLVFLGFLTPVGAALLVAQSVTIVALVAPRGFWHDAGGIEYPLVLAVASLAIGLVGPGSLSLDAAIGLRFEPVLAAAAAGLAVAGALAGLALRRAPATPPPDTGS